MNPSARLVPLAFVASLVFGSLGPLACAVKGDDVGVESSEAALRVPTASELVGTIAYGQTKGPIAYTEFPRYRALSFSGKSGDVARVTVASPGVAQLWLLGSDASTLSTARAAHLGANVALDQVLPTTGDYTIVLREADQEDTQFTVHLARVGCAGTSDCTSPPNPSPWRSALPPGALDLSTRVSVPVVQLNGRARELALRLTGVANGEVKLTFISAMVGATVRPAGHEKTVTVAPDGTFAAHLDYRFDTGQHMVEDVSGALLATGEVAISSWRVLYDGAPWSFQGHQISRWSPTNGSWPSSNGGSSSSGGAAIPPWRAALPTGSVDIRSQVSIPAATCTSTTGGGSLTQFGTRASVRVSGHNPGILTVTVGAAAIAGSATIDDTGSASISASGQNPHSTSYLRAKVNLTPGREIVVNGYEEGYLGSLSDSAGCVQRSEARSRF